MLFSMQEKREELRMRSENQAMNIVLQRQYDQYRLSIDNIELLRREFHDLKHYMIAIRSEQDPKKKRTVSSGNGGGDPHTGSAHKYRKQRTGRRSDYQKHLLYAEAYYIHLHG